MPRHMYIYILSMNIFVYGPRVCIYKNHVVVYIEKDYLILAENAILLRSSGLARGSRDPSQEEFSRQSGKQAGLPNRNLIVSKHIQYQQIHNEYVYLDIHTKTNDVALTRPVLPAKGVPPKTMRRLAKRQKLAKATGPRKTSLVLAAGGQRRGIGLSAVLGAHRLHRQAKEKSVSRLGIASTWMCCHGCPTTSTPDTLKGSWPAHRSRLSDLMFRLFRVGLKVAGFQFRPPNLIKILSRKNTSSLKPKPWKSKKR